MSLNATIHKLTGVECLRYLSNARSQAMCMCEKHEYRLWNAELWDEPYWFVQLGEDIYGPFNSREEAIKWDESLNVPFG